MIKNLLSRDRLYAAFVFAALFAYAHFYITTAIDVTDLGINLTQQLGIVRGWEEYRFGMLWFSEFVGGLWLLATAPLGLYGTALGWCTLVGLTGLMTFLFLRSYTSNFYGAALAIFSGIAMIPSGIKLIYYNNLAGSLLMLATFLFVRIYDDGNSKKSELFLILGYGLAIALSSMSRFPGILAFVVWPLIPVSVHLLCFKKLPRIILQRSLWCLLSAVIWWGVIALILAACGYFSRYWYQLQLMLGFIKGYKKLQHYGSDFLLNLYWSQFKFALPSALGFIGVLALMAIALRLTTFLKKGFLQKYLILAFTFLVSLYSFYFADLTEQLYRLLIADFFILFPLVFLATNYFYFLRAQDHLKRQQLAHYIFVITLLLATALLSFGGSSNGIINITFGLWSLAPMVALLSAQVIIGEQNKNFVALAIIIGFTCQSVIIRQRAPYRDWSERDKMTAYVDHPKLYGVRTTPIRAQVLSEVFKVADRLVTKGEVVLAYNSFPIFHYVTETRPYLGHPWPSLRGPEALSFMLKQLAAKPLPKILVRAKTNTQSTWWGNGKIVPPHNRVSHSGTLYLDEWARHKGYKVFWFNSDFVILKIPD